MRGLPFIAESFKIEMFEARSRDCSNPIVANSTNGHQRATSEASRPSNSKSPSGSFDTERCGEFRATRLFNKVTEKRLQGCHHMW